MRILVAALFALLVTAVAWLAVQEVQSAGNDAIESPRAPVEADPWTVAAPAIAAMVITMGCLVVSWHGHINRGP